MIDDAVSFVSHNAHDLNGHWYPVLSTPEFWVTEGNSLVTKINCAHPVVAIIDQFWYVDICCSIFSPNFSRMILIILCYTRKVLVLFTILTMLYILDIQNTKPLSIGSAQRVPKSSMK